MDELRLFFGGSVPATDWATFAETVLTPAFPDGFTIYEAAGQWRDPRDQQVVRERTRVVEVLGPAPSPGRLEGVVAAYRRRFHQLSVGVVSQTACASF